MVFVRIFHFSHSIARINQLPRHWSARGGGFWDNRCQYHSSCCSATRADEGITNKGCSSVISLQLIYFSFCPGHFVYIWILFCFRVGGCVAITSLGCFPFIQFRGQDFEQSLLYNQSFLAVSRPKDLGRSSKRFGTMSEWKQ